MRLSFTRFLLVILCVAPLCASGSLAQSNSSLEARRDSLRKLIAEEWEFEMRESPLAATYFGDYRYDDQIDDMSIAATLRQDKAAREYLARVEAIDANGFPSRSSSTRHFSRASSGKPSRTINSKSMKCRSINSTARTSVSLNFRRWSPRTARRILKTTSSASTKSRAPSTRSSTPRATAKKIN